MLSWHLPQRFSRFSILISFGLLVFFAALIVLYHSFALVLIGPNNNTAFRSEPSSISIERAIFHVQSDIDLRLAEMPTIAPIFNFTLLTLLNAIDANSTKLWYKNKTPHLVKHGIAPSPNLETPAFTVCDNIEWDQQVKDGEGWPI